MFDIKIDIEKENRMINGIKYFMKEWLSKYAEIKYKEPNKIKSMNMYIAFLMKNPIKKEWWDFLKPIIEEQQKENNREKYKNNILYEIDNIKKEREWICLSIIRYHKTYDIIRNRYDWFLLLWEEYPTTEKMKVVGWIIIWYNENPIFFTEIIEKYEINNETKKSILDLLKFTR